MVTWRLTPRVRIRSELPSTDNLWSEPGPKRLVLIVEDHLDTQSAVAEHLEQQGFEVEVASHGDAAMQLLRDRRPDLVYLDVNLPHISGYDVCEWIRTDPLLQDLAILMTSAAGSLNARAFSLDAGADVYLAKPYDLDRLAEVIARMLCNRKKGGAAPV